MGAASWWLVRLGLRPLDRMAQTAGSIAAGDLSRRVHPEDDRTEVGRLGLALNIGGWVGSDLAACAVHILQV